MTKLHIFKQVLNEQYIKTVLDKIYIDNIDKIDNISKRY